MALRILKAPPRVALQFRSLSCARSVGGSFCVHRILCCRMMLTMKLVREQCRRAFSVYTTLEVLVACTKYCALSNGAHLEAPPNHVLRLLPKLGHGGLPFVCVVVCTCTTKGSTVGAVCVCMSAHTARHSHFLHSCSIYTCT